MNVNVLQQFLHNLLLPLEASASPPQTLAALKRACQGFEPFRDKEVGAFADFLGRAADYEREGKCPLPRPAIAGHIVDEPSAQDYAQRLRTFLQREVPAAGILSDEVLIELTRLQKRLNVPQLKEMAQALQIEGDFSKVDKGMEKIVFHLTGLSLKEEKAVAPIRQYTAELRALAGNEELPARLEEVAKKLKDKDLKTLAESLGAKPKARVKKPELLALIRSALEGPRGEQTSTRPAELAPPQEAVNDESASRDGKISRLAEIVAELKDKADVPDAPYEEIEAELNSLEGQMNRDDAIAIAKHLGSVRSLNSRREALEEIRFKIFEMKQARESIAY